MDSVKTKQRAPLTALNEYSPTPGGLNDARARTQRQVGTSQKMVKVVFEVPDEHAPTLRSVVEEMTNQVGKAIEENIYLHEKELSLTRAASVLGKLRAAIYPKVPTEDPDFNGIL